MEQGDTRGHISIESFGGILIGLKSCLVVGFIFFSFMSNIENGYYTVFPRHKYFELLVFKSLDKAKAYGDKIKAKSCNYGEGYYITKFDLDNKKLVKLTEWFKNTYKN